MKEKSVAFTKGKSKFLENKRGEDDFAVDNLPLFSQSSGIVKEDIVTRNWTSKLSHKLPNNLGLKVVGNEEPLRLFNWLLNFAMNFWTS